MSISHYCDIVDVETRLPGRAFSNSVKCSHSVIKAIFRKFKNTFDLYINSCVKIVTYEKGVLVYLWLKLWPRNLLPRSYAYLYTTVYRIYLNSCVSARVSFFLSLSFRKMFSRRCKREISRANILLRRKDTTSGKCRTGWKRRKHTGIDFVLLPSVCLFVVLIRIRFLL